MTRNERGGFLIWIATAFAALWGAFCGYTHTDFITFALMEFPMALGAVWGNRDSLRASRKETGSSLVIEIAAGVAAFLLFWVIALVVGGLPYLVAAMLHRNSN